MKRISVAEFKKMSKEDFINKLTEKQRKIIENSKIDYNDLIKELKVLCIISSDDENMILDINKIINHIKNNDETPLTSMFSL